MMGKSDLHITVPSLFRCPISLDVMKSPVSLSTGVTYDRASIQRWLDTGNNTCPATMQVLPSKDFVPNVTLHRLIQIWSHNHRREHHQQSSAQLLDLINWVRLNSKTGFDTFVRILCFANESLENRKLLGSNKGFLSALVEMVIVDGPDPNLDPDVLEAVLKIFQLVCSALDGERKKDVFNSYPNLVPSLANIMKHSRSESRVAVGQIIESIASDPDSKKSVFDNRDFVQVMMDNLKKREDGVMHAVLSCLISLTTPRRNKVNLARAGVVSIIKDLLRDQPTAMTVELALTLLEALVGCPEGRAAITDNPVCLSTVVSKLMKVSSTANEHAVALLWSICYLFRDQKGRESVRKSNGGLTKIVLLMQTDCSPAVKGMCCDLLRIFRVNSKSCLSSYDTQTTHIMPS